MKKLLGFSVLFLLAAAVAFAGPAASSTPPDSMFSGGFWTKGRADQPYATMNHMHGSAYIAVARSQSSRACEFAIVAEKDGVRFQIIDEQGGYHSLPVTALLKLEGLPKGMNLLVGVDKPAAKSPSDAPVAAAKDDIPRGLKVVYAIARTRAVGELAAKEKISRAAAREKIDSISDKELHESATVAGLTKMAKDYPGEGRLQAIIEWLIENQELIKALVLLLLSFFS